MNKIKCGRNCRQKKTASRRFRCHINLGVKKVFSASNL
nr:MAG TPA: hypothetical protein [Caudoviricetes sp.]